ncbi:trypsin-like peptidase domain-containing protein [Streptomonospora nanhaiensis]|uniref:S1-C subfamily serine protease n=1 Tax=Streptomonospora nanhaiensis TaxID=1323731 RepID=A0A853BVG4_9ACTN|nr:trypsin-like peptidase domain-containing protein [Streptomonospora nanhaiensis]MBV2366736.1 trypsin-like peptidase domain-containing protein [Streptomonospora nanhaiensis]MBX9389493.1 trypsin-like peptidase domain-containing protein [Streptomonospora nanhaiensis]NYI98212.1 S1-C subfamily serine protease [Streptomonospora nanhaiensis]
MAAPRRLAAAALVLAALACAPQPPPAAEHDHGGAGTPSAAPVPPGPATARAGAPPAEVPGGVLAGVVSVRTRGGAHRGSAFRIGLEGVVVTAAGVVAGIEAGARVRLVRADGEEVPAELLGRAGGAGIAVLRVAPGSGLPPLASGTAFSRAREGDLAVAVGAPAALAAPAAPVVLRAKRRPVALGAAGVATALAAEGRVDPAAAGGPLVSPEGQVLGVITARTPPARGGVVAIPVHRARQAAFEILRAV